LYLLQAPSPNPAPFDPSAWKGRDRLRTLEHGAGWLALVATQPARCVRTSAAPLGLVLPQLTPRGGNRIVGEPTFALMRPNRLGEGDGA
jgi:hypothetical protein